MVMLRTITGLITLLFLASNALSKQQDPHRFQAHLNVLGNYQDSGKTWMSGGLGRFGYGDDAHDIALATELNLAYQYRPSPNLRFRANIQAQHANHSQSATDIGLIELDARYTHDIDFNQQVRFKLGQFFLPVSMENIDAFWESPYTISFSSLNSWIGEEFRPIGLDAIYHYHLSGGDRLTAAVTPFWGNDSMGTLLGFRGWSYGRQRTAYNDVIALPDLFSLSDSQPFGEQRDDGTKPFGKDLDGRPGYALRASYLADRFSANLSWIDNQGDTTLIDGEYAWRTKFIILGWSWFATDNLEILGEASSGSTTMGTGPGVDVSFYSAYIMSSYRFDAYRLSFRYDQFGIDDDDDVDQDSNEIGRSYTLALMWGNRDKPLHAGAEVMYLNSKRTKPLANGAAPHHDEESMSFSLLAQYRF